MKIKHIITSCLLGIGVLSSLQAQERDCDIHFMAILPPQDASMSETVSEQLFNRLCSAISSADVYADEDYARFFVSARMTPLFKETIPGPPANTAVTLSVNLYVGDIAGQKIFMTQNLELRGVGRSEERACINALRGLKPGNAKVRRLVEEGKKKVIDYYNKNFDNIVAKAKQCAAMKQNAEALFYITSIPECCNRYDEASRLALSYYKLYIDNNCRDLAMKARNAWMQSPDAKGAAEVAFYLNQIDPDAECYDEAESLYKEVKGKMKDDWEFEIRQKYNDAVDIEKSKIEAASAVGVAYGNGQKEKTTNLMWLK